MSTVFCPVGSFDGGNVVGMLRDWGSFIRLLARRSPCKGSIRITTASDIDCRYPLIRYLFAHGLLRLIRSVRWATKHSNRQVQLSNVPFARSIETMLMLKLIASHQTT